MLKQSYVKGLSWAARNYQFTVALQPNSRDLTNIL
jgi:hypothetical protein